MDYTQGDEPTVPRRYFEDKITEAKAFVRKAESERILTVIDTLSESYGVGQTKIFRVEVRTAHKSSSGKIYRTVKSRDNVDLYVWVLPDEIIYEPLLESFL